eukprot:2668588-Amphidinium_carterae.2
MQTLKARQAFPSCLLRFGNYDPKARCCSNSCNYPDTLCCLIACTCATLLKAVCAEGIHLVQKDGAQDSYSNLLLVAGSRWRERHDSRDRRAHDRAMQGRQANNLIHTRCTRVLHSTGCDCSQCLGPP